VGEVSSASGSSGTPTACAAVRGPASRAVPGIEGARQVVAGFAHACALIDHPGQVLCWLQPAWSDRNRNRDPGAHLDPGRSRGPAAVGNRPGSAGAHEGGPADGTDLTDAREVIVSTA
jgi:hypothetical protein